MDVRAIKEVFENIKARIHGLQGLLLITEDGFPIVSTLESGEWEERSTAVGAILCDAAQRGVEELGLGELEAVVTFGEKGYFVLRRLKRGAILMAVASPDVALGMVLLRLKKALPLLRKVIGGDL